MVLRLMPSPSASAIDWSVCPSSSPASSSASSTASRAAYAAKCAELRAEAKQRAREDAEYRQRQGWRGEADNQGELATEADEREVAAKMVSVRTSEF